MSNTSTFFNESEELIVESSTLSFDYAPTDVSASVFEYVNYVFLPLSIVVGTVGNFLTIVVMRSERFAGSPSSYLLIVLAISDSVAILSQPFNKLFFIDLVGTDIRALHDINCKLYIMIRRLSKMTSSWTVVGLCIERFIAVWFPLKAKLLITKRSVSAFTLSVVAIIITYTGIWSYASKVVNGKCNPDVYNYTDPRERTKFGIMLQGGTAIYSNVPTVLLMILTTLIIIKLFQHRRKRRSLTQRPSSTSDQGGKITAMLIGIVIAYVILILPITVLHNTAYQKRVKAFTETSSGFSLFTEVVQLMEQLNYCLNFFLYIMTSRQFRETLFKILSSKCHCKRTTQVKLPTDSKRTRY